MNTDAASHAGPGYRISVRDQRRDHGPHSRRDQVFMISLAPESWASLVTCHFSSRQVGQPLLMSGAPRVVVVRYLGNDVRLQDS